MGYSGIGYKTSGVRTVALAKAKGEQYYSTDVESVLAGHYPLSRYLYLYVNKAPNSPLDPLVREFLRYVLSRDGQEIVLKDGYLPLTEASARRDGRWVRSGPEPHDPATGPDRRQPPARAQARGPRGLHRHHAGRDRHRGQRAGDLIASWRRPGRYSPSGKATAAIATTAGVPLVTARRVLKYLPGALERPAGGCSGSRRHLLHGSCPGHQGRHQRLTNLAGDEVATAPPMAAWRS
jgi:hypothetical protein